MTVEVDVVDEEARREPDPRRAHELVAGDRRVVLESMPMIRARMLGEHLLEGVESQLDGDLPLDVDRNLVTRAVVARDDGGELPLNILGRRE